MLVIQLVQEDNINMDLKQSERVCTGLILNCGKQKNTTHAGDQTLVIQLVQEGNINMHLK